VRQAAVNKLTDQRLLAEIAKGDSAPCVRVAAVNELADQPTIVYIANHDENSYVRVVAVRKLTEQTTIAYIAKHDLYADVRAAAVKKLTDQRLHAEIAKEDAAPCARLAAVEMLTDQQMLAEIGRTDEYWEVRWKAISKLTDQSARIDLVKNDRDFFLRIRAADQIANPEVLAEVLAGKDAATISAFEMNHLCTKITDAAVIGKIAAERRSRALDIITSPECSLDEKAGVAIRVDDSEVWSALARYAERTLNGHMLVTTRNVFWQVHEERCLICGKIGGQTDDSESTRHYGCDFYNEPCRRPRG
jgi:uncharacterized DUF497 family protein